jgi:hypothetical protein
MRLRYRSFIFTAGLMLITFSTLGFSFSHETSLLSQKEMAQGQWIEDLDFLAHELPKKHKNLYHNISESEFQAQIDELKTKLSSMGQQEILVGLMKIIASIGDSHTTLGYRSQRALPLMLYWFKDGIAILNTTAEFEEILYGKITGLGNKSIDDVVAALAAVIPHENEAQVKNNIPNVLTDTLVLQSLKLIPSQESASLTVLTKSGRKVTVEMKPLSFSSKPQWLIDASDEKDVPLYIRNRGLFYWYEIFPDSQTLFFQYNSCKNMTEETFPEFVKKLFYAADTENVKRIVIDLRHNGGGNSGIFAPFLFELKKRPRFMQNGNIYVLIGRRTFSSAILNAVDLRKQTPALFAGEPTGGKPNHYGEVQMLFLPNSRLPVTYSVKYFQVLDDDPDSLIPDILVERRLSDYLNKSDPVLKSVLAKKP